MESKTMSENEVLSTYKKETLIALYLSAKNKAEKYDALKKVFMEMLTE
jgi:hypothetical protein